LPVLFFSGANGLGVATSRAARALAGSTLVVLLVTVPLIVAVGVVTWRTELSLAIARVCSVGEGRAIAIVSTSETVGWSPVAVDHAAGVPGSAAGHGSAVVEGLGGPAEPGALARLLRHTLVACCTLERLVLGMESSNHSLQLVRLQLRLLECVRRLAAEALAVAVGVLARLLHGLRLIGWRHRRVEIEHRLHGLEWCGVDVDATAVQRLGARLEHLRLGGGGQSRGGRGLLC